MQDSFGADKKNPGYRGFFYAFRERSSGCYGGRFCRVQPCGVVNAFTQLFRRFKYRFITGCHINVLIGPGIPRAACLLPFNFEAAEPAYLDIGSLLQGL